ncbi:MAG TPA: Gfo/Idh/MocA family oxidoreductase [Propionibacteriaceae bacterium]|nr:Gfo/Idh/MocA family oxidoreductase [Propionibacteriaceae bacterium]
MMSVLPASRIPDPYTAPPLRWGVVAPGGIAANMAKALRGSSQRIVAVGSRSQEHADEFAAKYSVERAYASYEQLVSDPRVEAVYVASPHSSHRDHALLAIEAGKPVLVEKAFTRNSAEARQVVEAARAANVACVEAMWPRFAPRFDIVRQVLESGELGEIIAVDATHNRRITAEDAPRLHDPDRAGGALLDLGVYPVSFISFALGTPTRVLAAGNLTPTGVDRTVAAVETGFAAHPSAVATVTTTLAAASSVTASISGTQGRIELDGSMFFYAPGRVRLVRPDGTALEAPEVGPPAHDALVYEASHLARLVAEGATESPYLPLDETVSIMDTLDDIRRQVGVAYPGE